VSFSVKLPINLIERSFNDLEKPVICKLVSCSRLEKPLPDKLLSESESTSNLFHNNDNTIV
jgi:hypothetical protein